MHEDEPLYPGDVLGTPPELREVNIRVHGPSVILVLEQDSPPHWTTTCTPEELPALASWLHEDERAAATWSAFHSVSAEAGQAELLERASREAEWRNHLYPEEAELRREQGRHAKALVTKALRS